MLYSEIKFFFKFSTESSCKENKPILGHSSKKPLLSQKEVRIYTEFEASIVLNFKMHTCRMMQNQMRTLTLLNIVHLIVSLQLIQYVSVAIIGSVNSSVIFIKVHYFFTL